MQTGLPRGDLFLQPVLNADGEKPLQEGGNTRDAAAAVPEIWKILSVYKGII